MTGGIFILGDNPGVFQPVVTFLSAPRFLMQSQSCSPECEQGGGFLRRGASVPHGFHAAERACHPLRNQFNTTLGRSESCVLASEIDFELWNLWKPGK